MIKCTLLNIYFLVTWILPGISVFIYLFLPVQTVKVFGGDISNQTTCDAAQLWIRTTSNGDILVSLLSGIALFKESDWHFRQTIIRICSISNFVHFSCFLYHSYFVHPHHIGLVVMYYSALSLTLLTGLGWGLNWDRILNKKEENLDHIQLSNESLNPV